MRSRHRLQNSHGKSGDDEMYRESREPVNKQLTPAEAEVFLAMNNFPGQRKYDPVKGRSYADNMESGTHRRIDIAIAKVKERNESFLMNGQHNCHALILYGKEYKALISYYVCETMEDAWRLFATFDVHASRTVRQFMNSRRGIFADERLRAIPLKTLNICGSALCALGDGTKPLFGLANRSKTAQADKVQERAEEVLIIQEYGQFSHLAVVGVVAAMLSIYRTTKKDLFREFWDKVASGEMMQRSDPRYKCREMLLRKAYIGVNGRALAESAFDICVAWWNSWRRGESRVSVKLASIKDRPKPLP